MAGRLDDVWGTRDFPVLVEITRLVDRGGYSVDPDNLVRSTGIDERDVTRAVHALERRSLVTVQWAEAGNFWVTDVAGSAYLMTGLHPDGADAVACLVDAIHQAAEHVTEPEEKSHLRHLGTAVAGVSKGVLAEVLAAVITKTALGA